MNKHLRVQLSKLIRQSRELFPTWRWSQRKRWVLAKLRTPQQPRTRISSCMNHDPQQFSFQRSSR